MYPQSGYFLVKIESVLLEDTIFILMKTELQKTVNIKYEKLLCDVQGNKTLDILLKKLKHQMVESMSSSTADALGLSRAILCNDSLVKKLEELERTEFMYNGLIDHTRRMLRAYFDVFLVYKGRLKHFCFTSWHKVLNT